MIEDIFIWPFIILGKIKALKTPLTEEYEIYFFFPFYHTGGAEKVHYQLAQAFKGRKAIILFTRRSHNEGFRQEFINSGHKVLDISAYTDHKKSYWNNLIWRGLVAQHINAQAIRPIVFNGQCNFAYKCAPWIRKDIAQMELLHSYNSFSQIRIPFLPYYYGSVMISRKAIADHLSQYKRLGIPEVMEQKIHFIQNGIPLPPGVESKIFSGRKLNILYAGRGTPEKRVHIVARIANQCAAENLPVEFTFLGEIKAFLDDSMTSTGQFPGNISNPEEIDQIYRQSDILIITSSEEGFPMVIMEAMARGCIILATPVGDIPAHIHQHQQGFLFSSVDNEEKIIEEAIVHLKNLLSDRVLCSIISETNIQYAGEHFSLHTFEKAYRKLFDSVKNRN